MVLTSYARTGSHPKFPRSIFPLPCNVLAKRERRQNNRPASSTYYRSPPRNPITQVLYLGDVLHWSDWRIEGKRDWNHQEGGNGSEWIDREYDVFPNFGEHFIVCELFRYLSPIWVYGAAN